MNEPLVIASHLPGEGHFHSDAFRVLGLECRDDLDYWRGVEAHWRCPHVLVLLEHDIEATDKHVAALLDCPHPLCSHAYRCHWASTGLPHDVIAAGPREGEYLQGGEEWAEWSAIGLVKITPEARIGPLRREPWDRLELAIHAAVKRPWCVHWPPVPHHHW